MKYLLALTVLAATANFSLVGSEDSLEQSNECSVDKLQRLDGSVVDDILKKFGQHMTFVHAKCEPDVYKKKDCSRRDYSAILDKMPASLAPQVKAQISEVVGALAMKNAKQAMEKCDLFFERMLGGLRYAKEINNQEQIDVNQIGLTLISFFKTEAFRMIRRFGEASGQLGETENRNKVSQVIPIEELSKSKALIEYGRLARFNSQVDKLLGFEQPAYLDEVEAAYSQVDNFTKPLVDFKIGEKVFLLSFDGKQKKKAAKNELDESEGDTFCQYARKLQIVGASSTDNKKAIKDYSDILSELKEFDASFADRIQKDVVSQLQKGELKAAWQLAELLVIDLHGQDESTVMKQLYDIRNIWSKNHREGLRSKRSHIVALRTYATYFLAEASIQAGKYQAAELMIRIIKRDRQENAGVGLDKILRLEGDLTFKAVEKFNKDVELLFSKYI